MSVYTGRHRSRRSRWADGARAVTAVVALIAGLVVTLVTAAPASAATSPGSGSAYADAGASCWGIKQAYPSSADGAYWIQTPQLIAPVKVYCDMTGGGWELVGRGRNGFTWSAAGQGSAAAVYTTPTGTGAFAPATLSSATIDGLLNGTRVDALPGGVQLRRATNDSSFSNPQIVTLTMSNRPTWSWAFGGGELVSSVSFNGSAAGYPSGTSGAGNTAGVVLDNVSMTLNTEKTTKQNYQYGFGYGSSATGSSSSSDYLYNYSGSGDAFPFTQIWVQPQIPNSVSYPAIPASGTAATSVGPLLSNTVAPAPWGVTGLMKSYAGESTMQVESFTQLGSTMFVSGLFSTVQNSSGSTQVAQPYLAAFDLSGNWISSFRPAFNGEVWTAVPFNGELLVGGDFTSVNGIAEAGIALLNPTTGAVDTSWNAGVAGSTGRVRDLRVFGGYVYVGGSFTQLGASTGRYGHNNIGRIVAGSGRVDQTWKPSINGAVFEVDPSAAGDRVYAVGNFTQVNGQNQADQATLDTSSGNEVPGLQQWVPSTGSGSATYQQTTLEVGNTVWQGGSQHILSAYNRADYSRITSFITKSPPTGLATGGDLQRIVDVNGVIYGSCHCSDYVYSGTYNWSNPVTGNADVNPVDWMFAVDTSDDQIDPGFYVPGLKSAHGNGVWAMGEDSNQCLWFGGDLTGVGTTWLGSFGRVCSRDTTAPGAASFLTTSKTSVGPKLTWNGSTDNSGVAPAYEVLRNDRVIATVTGTTYTDTGGSGTYYVRAVDATGNRSASTPGVTG